MFRLMLWTVTVGCTPPCRPIHSVGDDKKQGYPGQTRPPTNVHSLSGDGHSQRHVDNICRRQPIQMPLNPHSCGDCGLCNCLMARICQGELLVVVVMVCQIRGMCVKVLLVGNYGNAKNNDNNMLWCSHNNTITPPCAIIIMSLQSEVNTHRQQMPPPKTTRQRTIHVPPSSYRRPCSGGRCDGRRKGCGRKFNINTIIIIPHLQSHLLISSHSYSSLSP